jgi:hypothetical protein
MLQNVLVGLVAGVASALLFVAPFGGTPLALPLFALTGLPIAIAGFGWGGVAAVASVAAGSVLALGIAGSGGAIIFAFLFAIPVAWATVAATQPTTTRDGRGYRPLGLVLAHAAGAVTLGVIVIGVLAGFDPAALAAEFTPAFVEWAAAANPETLLTESDVAPLVGLYVTLLPATVAFLGVAMVVLDLVLGVKSVGLSDRLKRAPDELWTVSLPPAVPAAFVVATALAFLLPGAPGYAAQVVTGALGAAVALEGLAVIHAVTRGMAWRGPLLAVMYAMILLSGLPILLFALLGIAESFFHFRARRLTPRGPTLT